MQQQRQFITHKRASIRLTGNISSETVEARRLWDYIVNELKEKLLTKNSMSGKTVLQK